jgi:EmrB/QacA subfamily drug resistance transporter
MSRMRVGGERRWLGLGVIAFGQLLVSVDLMVILIALPTIGQALHMSTASSPWVITTYSLSYGALLLLGGRMADYGGRKRAFLVGIAGFAVASALGGAASSSGMLLGARALQGVSAALLMPAGLSLLSTMFVEPRERALALAIFGAVGASGIALGMILGGAITEYLSWRWCLLVNVPLSVMVFVCAIPVLSESSVAGRPRFDLRGAVLGAVGIGCLVYACAHAGSDGWGNPVTVGCLIAAVALCAIFAVVETRVTDPLLPLHLLRNPRRSGSLLGLFFAFAGAIGLFLFLIYYLQGIRHWSAVQCGLALLPYAVAATVGALVLEKPLGRMRPGIPIVLGLCGCAAACLWFAFLAQGWSYPVRIAPALAVLGVSIVSVFVATSSAVLAETSESDAGVCSALFNVVQQLAFAVGPALLTSVAVQATRNAAAGQPPTAAALLHGYHVGDACAAAIVAGGTVLCLVLLRRARSAQSESASNRNGTRSRAT